jgi:hypothetical protein
MEYTFIRQLVRVTSVKGKLVRLVVPSMGRGTFVRNVSIFPKKLRPIKADTYFLAQVNLGAKVKDFKFKDFEKTPDIDPNDGLDYGLD